MKLIKDEIVLQAAMATTFFCQQYRCTVQEMFDEERFAPTLKGEDLEFYAHSLDFAATGIVAKRAQTFIFDHDQVVAFLPAIHHALAAGDYPAPFEDMIFQFSKGVDETLFTTGTLTTGGVYPNDEILGLVIAMPSAQTSNMANVTAYYKSTSINRAAFAVEDEGEILFSPLNAIPDHLREVLQEDKQKIVNLALLCLAYLNSPAVEVEHVKADAAINRKRAAKGKRVLPDYYICHIRKEYYTTTTTGKSDRHVSFMFPVRSHLRRLPDGRMIRIKSHYRGLAHSEEPTKPKVYKVS